jgi:hypothetical protein
MTGEARLVLYVFGYALLLILALIVLNVALGRLTREERRQDRERRSKAARNSERGTRT